jgi:hypothetical protein
VAVEPWRDDIDQSLDLTLGAKNSSRKHYPKLIVEVFREIGAECTAPLTAP